MLKVLQRLCCVLAAIILCGVGLAYAKGPDPVSALMNEDADPLPTDLPPPQVFEHNSAATGKPGVPSLGRAVPKKVGVADKTGIAGGMPLPSSTSIAPAKLIPSTSTPTPARPNAGPPSLFDDSSQSTELPALLQVRINTPRISKAIDVLVAYPYPVKPPRVAMPQPLPDQAKKGLRETILSTGYNRRTSPDKVYPMGGIRWQRSFNKAVTASGLGVPHTILTMYGWADQMMPYVVAQNKLVNQQEKTRFDRYQKFNEDWERHHTDIENDSVRAGLSPVQLMMKRSGIAERQLPAGTWWLTCTRRLPGVTYYWQIPLTAAPGEQLNLVLTENNAMVITGGW